MVYLIEDIVHSIVHKRKSVKKEEILKQNGNYQKRNLTLSCGTLTNGDNGKGLHNNEVEITPAATPTSTASTVAVLNTNAISNNGSSGGGGRNDRLNKATLSLSPSDEIRINPNHLRETKEIFCKNAIHDEIPGLSNSRYHNGIANGGFVSEKFQYCADPDWWKDIVNTNSQMNLLTGSNCTMASCVNPNGKDSSLNIHQSQDIILHSNDINIISNADERQIYHRNQKQQQHEHSYNQNNNHHHHQTHGHSHMHLPMDDETIDPSIGGEIRNILIVVAISFHGIFEGMAIGLQSTEMDVWYLFLAVSLHECTILFCIGVELISSKTKVCRMITYILVVSLVSPVGIAIGIVVTEKSLASGNPIFSISFPFKKNFKNYVLILNESHLFPIGIHHALVVGCIQVSFSSFPHLHLFAYPIASLMTIVAYSVKYLNTYLMNSQHIIIQKLNYHTSTFDNITKQCLNVITGFQNLSNNLHLSD